MIRLGVPSKGRLMEKTFAWFADRGVALSRVGGTREYAGVVEGMPEVSLILLSAGEVPRELAAGNLTLGVTGRDLIEERLPLWEQQVEPMAELGFGHADLILAVPKGWVDVETTHDLDAVAAQFRSNHGKRLRIATKYHRLVRDFLRDKGVADYAIVDSQGATEGTVANGAAEAIADITSTGETLRANHLKILSDGLVLKSQATLWRSRVADVPDRSALQALLDKLDI